MAGIVSVLFDLDMLFTGDNVQSTFSLAANEDGYYDVVGVTVVAGYNSIPVPSWAVGVQIIPPVTNTEGITLKGATGDTGIPISVSEPTGPIMFTGSPPATIGLTAAGNITAGPVFFRFF